MKSTRNRLNDTILRNLKPKEKLYRKADSNGLAIEVAVSGSKIWRYRYRFNKKATMITLGHYPAMKLLDARQARDTNRQLLVQGINPKKHKAKESQSGKTFSDIFTVWHALRSDEWSDDYSLRVHQRAERHLLPFIGNSPMEGIETADIVDALMPIDKRGGLDTLSKVKGIASNVFKYAVGMGIIKVNPVRDMPTDIFTKNKKKNYPTITDPKEIRELLRKIDSYSGSYQVEKALWLAPYLFLRPGELVEMEWNEVDLNDRIIRIKGERMKMKKPHLVPMSRQVYEFFDNFRQVNFNSEFVFPTPIKNKDKPITTAALLSALRRQGIKEDVFTTHSFRSMASTRLNEMTGVRGDTVEMQLAHRDSNTIRDVYNHAHYLEERIDMMQIWSDYLDKLKATA
jgi:integrase